MCFLCFFCARGKQRKYDEEGETNNHDSPRPSTTSENEAIIDNMAFPPKQARRNWFASTSTVFGSETESISPPSACNTTNASSPEYIHAYPSPAEVNMEPHHGEDPKTQFKMDSCGDSTSDVDTPRSTSTKFWTDLSPVYDVLPIRKKPISEELDEVFVDVIGQIDSEIQNCKDRESLKQEKADPALDERNTGVVVKKILLKKDDKHASNSAPASVNGSLNKEKPRLRRSPGTPPLPRCNTGRMTLWSAVKDIDTPPSSRPPRPCTTPHYVNFKGCLHT